MKKIVHLCLNGIYTDGFTYQENVLTKYHNLMGYNTTIITNQYMYNKGNIVKDDRVTYINEDGVNIIRLSIKNNKDFNYKFKKFNDLYKTMEEINPDILFIHGLNFSDIVTVQKYLKNHNDCLAYADNHCDSTNSGATWISLNILHKVIWRIGVKRIIPFIKKFYGVQPVRVKWLIDVYKIPAEKCELLIMGADDEYVKKYENHELETRKKLNIEEDDFLIVTGGKIDSKKTEVLDLMKSVNEINNNKIKLLIFGSVAPELKDEFDQLLSEKILNYGWISDSEKSFELFSIANLACFPGRHSVFWEQCVAQGIPLLCKKLNGVEHIDIGGNVEFIENVNVHSIKEAINKIVDNKDYYDKMKMAATSDLRDNFLYSKIAKKSLEG